MSKTFSLQDAQNAKSKGVLKEWIISYLRTQGNNPDLASHINRADLKVDDLREISLSKFERIIGPEEGMIFPESQELFDERISKLVDALNGGEEFPPLVVTDFWKLGTIQDGAHRFEALKRVGRERYPAVVLFQKQESLNWLESN